ncbi:MAG: tetratricopeptide repeat protein [Rikenellaceae bacterium]
MNRRIFYIVLSIATLFTWISGWSQEVDTLSNEMLWERANTAYVDKDYSAALDNYQMILDRGVSSPELLYNIGNAYYKRGELGKSILYYNKALKLAPVDADIIYNLRDVAQQQIRDRIESVPEFFLFTMHRNMYSNLSSDQWAIFSLVILVIGAIFMLIFLLSNIMMLRKVSFFAMIFLVVAFACTTSYSIGQRNELLDRSEAIIMAKSITVKSSPDSSSTDLFILHEGTKVELGKRVGDWVEITIIDGKRGWMDSKSLEII